MASAFGPDGIHIRSLRVYYDQKTKTRVTEKDFLVQYESQHFRCKATIELEESTAKSHWTIGLVQACDSMMLENRYGRSGSSLWEFHPLKARYHEMVNDSDGRQYPFYSMNTSKLEVARGCVPAGQYRLHYGDHFYPTVAWQLPYCSGVHLTDVIRKQDFWVWLVAIRRHKGGSDQFHTDKEDLHILKTMRWRYNLHLRFDPHERLGRRLKWVKDKQKELPFVMETDTPVPLSAVHPPHCNAAQSLIWYPNVTRERPALLVPPKQTVVPWTRWVQDMIPSADRVDLRKPTDLKVCPLWSRDSPVALVRASSCRPQQPTTAPPSQPRTPLATIATCGSERQAPASALRLPAPGIKKLRAMRNRSNK